MSRLGPYKPSHFQCNKESGSFSATSPCLTLVQITRARVNTKAKIQTKTLFCLLPWSSGTLSLTRGVTVKNTTKLKTQSLNTHQHYLQNLTNDHSASSSSTSALTLTTACSTLTTTNSTTYQEFGTKLSVVFVDQFAIRIPLIKGVVFSILWNQKSRHLQQT